MNFSKNSFSLPGITFPLCSSLSPTLLEGQLCYKLELNMKSGPGRGNQLMLVLDYNEDRSLQTSSNEADHDHDSANRETMNLDTTHAGRRTAKIHFQTLSPHVHFGGGICFMTDVKRMTATKDFLKMSSKERNCEVEIYEDCRTRKLLEKCNCVPWEVPGYQVME